MRLIDADELIKRINGTGYHEQIKSNLLFIAKRQPTIDAVDRELYEQCKFDKDIAEEQLKKIVRCKDCKFFVKAKDWFACQKWYMDIREDDYCSYGERKEDDEQ